MARAYAKKETTDVEADDTYFQYIAFVKSKKVCVLLCKEIIKLKQILLGFGVFRENISINS